MDRHFFSLVFVLCAFFLLSSTVSFADDQEKKTFSFGWPLLRQPWYFHEPSSLAADSNGNVFVVDRKQYRIVKFNPSFQFVTSWGKYGTNPGEFIDPFDIAIDSNGELWVTDTGNNRIQHFTSDGVFMEEWGSFGTEPGHFNEPTGIAIDTLQIPGISEFKNFQQKEILLPSGVNMGRNRENLLSPTTLLLTTREIFMLLIV